MSFCIGYLDLGAGSMFLQIILAGIMGAGFVIKQYWRRITGFFGRKSAEDDPVKEKNAAFPEEGP